MKKGLWRFTDHLGSFESVAARRIRTLYFPLANDNLKSAVTPYLNGDIKSSQSHFLLEPVSRIDLVDSKSSRNFWVYLGKDNAWSVTGVSKDLKRIEEDQFRLEAGLLWHRITRENKRLGLKAEVLSFVPASGEPLELMQVRLTNISGKTVSFTPIPAIPIYARGADNLRDHRHVTSLLQRIRLHKFGVIVKPTLSFDESGHRPNSTSYFVLGWEENFRPPRYLYPTQELFCLEAGDLEAPLSVLKNILPPKNPPIQGREAMGALRFSRVTLRPKQTRTYLVIMGIVAEESGIEKIIRKFNTTRKVEDALKKTRDFWIATSSRIGILTPDSDFNNWFRWVAIQPALRRIFGCSFLPDFDYGKGGKGWRDLWQDCLGLILNNPQEARSVLINNFAGVRIDGSNATIIGTKPGEFISDRNNISRVWADHGAWPLITLDLYLNETPDPDILLEETVYFRNHELVRARERDEKWVPGCGQALKTKKGKVYRGTLLEHLLVENLIPFFNVGSHNYLRLEGADWNDGLDMAREKGESVAFSAMYAHNLGLLSELLLKSGKRKVRIAKELNILLRQVSYRDIKNKRRYLEEYFSKTRYSVSGEKTGIDSLRLSANLKSKSRDMSSYISRGAWLKEGFFNGYYDNLGRKVEGRRKAAVRMILSSQVFPIMAGIADPKQIKKIIRSAEKYLFDKKLGGYHLNTDFKGEQHKLGRAFSFVYGDKENGAVFNHMAVMFAYALYKRGFKEEGWRVLRSIYGMAMATDKSRTYPCIPEYFDLQGKGMYSYLTGSASWFVLTLLTEVFGIKGRAGDLLIEPKLSAGQFKESKYLMVNRSFAGRLLRIGFCNPAGGSHYRIVKAELNGRGLGVEDARSLIIKRRVITALPQDKINTLNIVLG